MNFDELIACALPDEFVCVSPTESWLDLLEECESPYPNEQEEEVSAADAEAAAVLSAAKAKLSGGLGGLDFSKRDLPPPPPRRARSGDGGGDGEEDERRESGIARALAAPDEPEEEEAAAAGVGDCASGETLTFFLPNGAPVTLVLDEEVTVGEAVERLLHKVGELLGGGGALGRGADALGHGAEAAACYEVMLHDADGLPDDDCPALERDRPCVAFGTDELCLVEGAAAPAIMPDDRQGGAPAAPARAAAPARSGVVVVGPTSELTVYLPDATPAGIHVGERTTVAEAIELALGAAPPERGLGGGARAAACYELLLHDSDGLPDEDCPALEREGPALAFGEDELCLRLVSGAVVPDDEPAAEPAARRSSSRSSRASRRSSAFPRPSKTGLCSIRVLYDEGDFVDLKTDGSWTVAEILPRVLRRRQMHNWGIPYGFKYLEEDQARLCFPEPFVCDHLTVGDLAMSGVFTLQLYCELYAGGWYLDAPAAPEPSLVKVDPHPRSEEAQRRRDAGGGERRGPPDPRDFQFTPASGVAFKEWNVVKTNELGRRQERVLGVDGSKIYNTKRDRKNMKLITLTYRPSRRIEDVLSLKILDQYDDRRTVRMTFTERGKQIVRDLEFDAAQEAAHAVAKIRYNRALLLENRRRFARPDDDAPAPLGD